MISYIKEYLDLIKKNPKKFCKEQRQLVKWLPGRLKGASFNQEKTDEMIEYIEKWFFPLMPFQKFLCSLIVGVTDDDGSPIFDEFLIYGGRGLGKNGFISGVSDYLISNRNGIRNYHVHIVANSEDQAKTSFNDVYDVIEMNPILQNAHYYTRTEIKFKATGSVLTYKTSSAKSADGGRPGCVIFDEIHAYENEDTLQVHKSGLGKTDDPRIFYLTTDGYVREGFLDKQKEKSEKILFDGEDDDGFFPMIFKLDSKREAKDPEKWVKANPRLDYSKSLKKLMIKQYKQALEDESSMVEFLTKRMNLPVVNKYRSVASWEDICRASDEELPDLTGHQCIGAIDYAGIRDFCSVGLLFRDGDKAYLIQHSFVHESSLENTKFNFPIKEADSKGLITIIKDTPSIPTSVVLEWFLKQAEKYSITEIVADRYRLSWLKDEFLNAGIELQEVGNGYITHHKLYPLITKLFADGLIKWGDDMLMRWYTNNTMVDIDKKGNCSYKKIEPIKKKTDGFFMLIHALSRWDKLYINNYSYSVKVL